MYKIGKKPERIICLTEEPTEILYLLGEAKRIVGISAFTCRPIQAKAEKPVVSGFTGGNVKKILELQPDLIIGFSDIQAELAKTLIAANQQVLIFNQRSIQEILDVIGVIGRLVGQEKKTEQLVSGYIEKLSKAEEKSRNQKHHPRVYFEEWDDPMISCIAWVSELITLAGGRDIFADRCKGKLAKQRYTSAQEVVEREPEIYIASWCGKPFVRESVIARPGWQKIPALEQSKLFELDPSIILQPGPACLTDGLAALEAILRP